MESSNFVISSSVRIYVGIFIYVLAVSVTISATGIYGRLEMFPGTEFALQRKKMA